MADGLSLAASIIAVLGAADSIGKTLSQVKILRDAPDELLALNNEISDLTITLRHVDSCMSTATTEGTSTTDGRAVPQDAFHHLSTLITRAKDQILQLEKLIHYRLLKSGSFDRDYKVFRVRWARARSAVEKYRKALRDIRQNVVMQLLIITSSQQSRALFTINDVFVISNQMRATQLSSIEQACTQMNTQTGMLTTIANGNVNSQNTLQSNAYNDPQTQFSMPVHSVHFQTVLGIKASVLNPQLHQRISQCKCSCHSPRRLRSPRLFDGILGALFIGYFGYPFNIQKCASTACQTHSTFVARVQYHFPFWLFQKMLDMALIVSSFQEPYISLTVRAILPSTAEIFRLAMCDDADGLQRLFTSGHARPNDQSYALGATALKWALGFWSLEACKVLLAAGSDPYIEDAFKISPFDLAWSIIFTALDDSTRLKTLRNLFPDHNNLLENYRFSKLHKTILGLITCNLKEVIAANGADIDIPDSKGRTALSWAVRREDISATKLLLKAEANPNIADISGETPLFQAVSRGNLAFTFCCIFAEGLFSTPNSEAFNHCEGSEIVKLLVASAFKNHIGGVQSLLECGAKINHLDSEGDTSIMTSTLRRCDKVTSLLLRHGADYTLASKAGNTILHYAARGGGLETLEVLRIANLTNINPSARNTDGKTALELAQNRVDTPDGFVNLFLTLIFEIRNRNDHLAGYVTINTGTIVDEVARDITDNTGIEEPLKIPGAWPQE